MIRLACRQFRTQAVVALGGLVIVAIVVALTGPELHNLYNTTVAVCKSRGDCETADTTLVSGDSFLRGAFAALVIVLPALLGVFWGAPLVARELEAGTFRLAWTQSVTRTRWLAASLGVVGLASVVVVGLVSLMVTWWYTPIDRVNATQFAWTVFDARNIVPMGYALFAFALGVTAGALMRRTLPAMATTAGGFIAARVAITHWIRPNLLAPVHLVAPLTAAGQEGFQGGASGQVSFIATNPIIPNALVVSNQIVDKAGRTPAVQTMQTAVEKLCPKIAAPPQGTNVIGPGPATFQQCITQLAARFHLAITDQPPGRYWTIQSLELAVYVALALILAGVCFWAVCRRLS